MILDASEDSPLFWEMDMAMLMLISSHFPGYSQSVFKEMKEAL